MHPAIFHFNWQWVLWMKTLSQHSPEALEGVADLLKAMGDATRLKIMQLLHQGEHTVGEIVAQMNCSQANVSKHLRVLYNAGVVALRKEGSSVWYFISDDCVTQLCLTICKGHNRLFEKKIKSLRMKK